MVNIQSRVVNVKGINTHYYECGQGEPLIIVHGGSAGASSWKNNIEVLSMNYHVYAPDLPGFGLTSIDLDSYAVPEVAEFVNQFSIAAGLKSFNLIGHSFGGGIAAHLALKYPSKVRKLVLVSSLCLGKEIAWWVRMFSSRPVCQIVGKVVITLFKGIKFAAKVLANVVIEQPIKTASLEIGSSISNYTQQKNVLLAQLPDLLVPTLVVWGGNDPIVPMEHAYAAGTLIPDCRVKVFTDCGHSVYREKFGEFSSVLAGFLG
ncbi:MAG TPA: alpha/beta hydrolase [Dehalococcoidales bacterium]|nr:alpha/beta hydrolase [Dehalococcoidales bacterium]